MNICRLWLHLYKCPPITTAHINRFYETSLCIKKRGIINPDSTNLPRTWVNISSQLFSPPRFYVTHAGFTDCALMNKKVEKKSHWNIWFRWTVMVTFGERNCSICRKVNLVLALSFFVFKMQRVPFMGSVWISLFLIQCVESPVSLKRKVLVTNV